MSRRPLAALLAVLAVLLAGPLPAAAQDDPTVTTAPIPPPRASIVVDLATGEVITAANEREPLPPASTTKILTTLLARQRLGLDAEVGISQTAAIAPPRRLQLPAGTTWEVEDLVYAAMLCSCNDAAWALGQAAGGGSMAGYETAAGALAEQLGLADGPVLRDPAGLDDSRSVRGGNLISARDLAIAARAYLADPDLAAIAVAPEHTWVGGDGRSHTVTNLNRFLGRYDGAEGLKTGSTSRAGLTFVAAAERDGRHLLAVVLGSENHYAHARELLDRGFLLAGAGTRTGDVLPAVPDGLGAPTTTTTTSTTASTTTTSTSAPVAGSPDDDDGVLRSHPPAEAPADDGDTARTAVWAAVGGAAGLAVVALAVAARRRLSRRVDRRPARPRRRDRA